MLITTLTLVNQPIWVFNLQLTSSQRKQRREKLDALLAKFFTQEISESAQQTTHSTHFWQNFEQFIKIIHHKGQPAKAVFLTKTGKQTHLPLAISYALPYVAVAISGAMCCEKTGSLSNSQQPIGLDICAVADFAVMSSAEKQQFCQDYFANMPRTEDSGVLARRWSVLEATLKHLQLPLSHVQDNRYFFDYLPPLSVVSDSLYLDDKKFWVSVAMD